MDSYGFLNKAKSILIPVTNLAVPPDLRSVGQRLSYYPNVSKYPEVSKYPPPPVGLDLGLGLGLDLGLGLGLGPD